MTASFLATDLQKVDPDRYLLSLFAPAPARPQLMALFLFHHELVRTRSVVSDTRLGLIRLQWWRDEIAKIYAGGACGQIPILSTLAPAMLNGTLPREEFESLLYAREFDLEDVSPETLDGLRHYVDFTTTPLNRLALKIVGESASEDEIRAISTNFGLFEAIRSVPKMLSDRRCLLPYDLLATKNVTPQKIIDFNHKAEIVDVIKVLVSAIESYRKPESRLLKIQQTMSRIYLDKITKIGYDIFAPEMQVPPPFLALRLWLSSLSR